MRVEVLGGVERRRRWSRDEKMRILAESLEPGAKVAEVARRCKGRLDFPQKRRSKIPHFGGMVISPLRDRLLHVLAAVLDV